MSIYKTSPADWNKSYPDVLADAYQTCSVRSVHSDDYKPCCENSCKKVCGLTGKCVRGWNTECNPSISDNDCTGVLKDYFNQPKRVNSSRQFAVSTKSQTNIGIGIGIFVFAMIFLLVLYVHSLNR